MASRSTRLAIADHRRDWHANRYVYPVISRRSRGLSIGINLQPSGACNFDCVYCCVDRSGGVRQDAVDLDRLDAELREILASVADGSIWEDARLADVDPPYRRLRDLAFSGNGEPTLSPAFGDAVDLAIGSREEAGFADEAKIVLITNATTLDPQRRPGVASALRRLDAAGGFEPWVKLDAGTPEYFRRVDRSHVRFDTVLRAIEACGKARPIVIQTMLCKLDGEAMPDEEFVAYGDRLVALREAGCDLRGVHLYTVARRAAVAGVTPVEAEPLLDRARALQRRLGDVPVEAFPAPDAAGD